MKVVGIERIDYTNKEGRRVVGTKLSCVRVREKVEGVETLEPLYCNAKVDTSNVAVGDEIEVYFNAYNKPAFIEVL